MNDKNKTTRKSFLKWSGLALLGSSMFLGKSLGSEKASAVNELKSSETLPAMSRINPAKRAIVRDKASFRI